MIFGQGFYHILFLESISSNIECVGFDLDHIITFKGFISNLIYDIWEIPWLQMCRL